ncbi:MAG: hypothetical protein ACTMIR_01090 [Cellulomonadaceae bacterium]
MLTETDPRVLADVNLHAVLGSLPRLADLSDEAHTILSALDRPVALTLQVVGGGSLRLVFSAGVPARLLFASPAHLNAVIAGTAQPLPLAGPRGLRFLTSVFTPLTELLARHLKPADGALADPALAATGRTLLLHVAVRAIVVVGDEDRAGRYSAAQMPDGDVQIAVGDELTYRLRVRNHRLTLVAPAPAPTPPRAELVFADLSTAGDVLAGRESALACVGDGRITLRGYIPLVDNVSRILERVGQYLS